MMQSFKFKTKEDREYTVESMYNDAVQMAVLDANGDTKWYNFTPEEFKAFIKLAGMLVAEVDHD